jgi:hypothetical protein
MIQHLLPQTACFTVNCCFFWHICLNWCFNHCYCKWRASLLNDASILQILFPISVTVLPSVLWLGCRCLVDEEELDALLHAGQGRVAFSALWRLAYGTHRSMRRGRTRHTHRSQPWFACDVWHPAR